MSAAPAKRIVLTGGPGAGKSVISQRLVAAHPHRFVLVPEAATQVYAARQTRWDRLDLEGRRDVQRGIYRLQREQEDRLAAQHPGKVLLHDRGTIDGAAYWPEGPEDYWRDLRSSLQAELARYHAVIWLQSAAALGIYDGDASNECRFEDAEAAIASGNKLVDLWGSHPQFQRINAHVDLDKKVDAVIAALDALIQDLQDSNRA
jgi:predicted ATPase